VTYLDASALVKLFVPEVESDALNASLLGATDIVVSDLAVTESASALGRRVREGQVTRRAARDLHRRIIAFADRAIGVETVPAVHHEARRLLLASDQPLRTLDALHLALALDAQATSIVTYDPRLRDASLTQGLEVQTPTVRAR
jgi:predicted nucleic acid-binding protein